MPGGDRTGPAGFGPMTGRGAGYCAGYMNSDPGRGYSGYGRGFGGRGWRNRYYATGQPGWARYADAVPPGGAAPYYPQEISPGQEAETLRKESAYLKQDLKDIEDRIKTLEKETGKNE